MKRNVPIIIGIVALCVLLYAGNSMLQNRDTVASEEQEITQSELTTFSGSVTRFFEGDNVLQYSFDLPLTATTSIERDGALVKVEEQEAPLFAMYLSYEGGRGYSPEDYVNEVIAKSVASVTVTGTTTLGLNDWYIAESQWSVWHIAKARDGEWLAVVEYPKNVQEKVLPILESLMTK